MSYFRANKSCFFIVALVFICSVVFIALISYHNSFYEVSSWSQFPQLGIFRDNHSKLPSPEKSCIKKNVSSTSKITVGDLYVKGHFKENLSKICPNDGISIKVLILILSAPAHFNHRMAIRSTWGRSNPDQNVATAFLLGDSRDQLLENQLTKESGLYGDLIRGHSLDSYENLTLKSTSMLEWTWKHCSKAKFLLKTDDDMFINVAKLVQFAEDRAHVGRSIYGRLAVGWPPIRNRASKWYVSPEEYGLVVYPTFTTGPAYLLTADLVAELYCESLVMPYFKLEDVFLTGLVAERLNVSRVDAKEFANRRIAPNDMDHCKLDSVISIHDLGQIEQFELWKQLHDTGRKCGTNSVVG